MSRDGKYNRSPRGKYRYYKYAAKRHGRGFSLSFEEFKGIINLPCTYCGEEPGGGVDRVSSSEGYIRSNVVPCCRTCNMMKNDMSVSKFIKHCTKVIRHVSV